MKEEKKMVVTWEMIVHGRSFNKSNAKCFKNNKEGEGGEYLVGLSQFNLKTLKDKISEEDVWIYLKMAKICFHCSKGVMTDICFITKEISLGLRQ
eukprot:10029766-Ditylum_brightwellii.AAC.1